MSTNARPLLEWLLQKYPDTPKSRAKEWILAGRVSVNSGVIRKPHEIIPDPGVALELRARSATSLQCGSGLRIHPRVTLLFLDSAVAIVNKAPGLVSVPAPNCDLSALSILSDFLAGRLRPRDRNAARRPLPPAYRRLQPLPVHRLDQYTSGVFCMATNPAARRRLIAQLKTHAMNREYVAFAEGRAGTHEGVWKQWVRLSPDGLRQQVISETEAKDLGPEARQAITHYEVLAEFPAASGARFATKLRLRLETGRKHQIRVQTASAGLPLIGDRAYNPGLRGTQSATPLVKFPRQALHAETLSLEHPDQPGTRMSWTAEMPEDLRQLERTLQSGRF